MSSSGQRYHPDRWYRKWLGPIFGAVCLMATCTGVLVLVLVLGAIVSAALSGPRDNAWYDYDLRLLYPMKPAMGLPANGQREIIVAEVDGVLQFRVFNEDGQTVIDTDERRLAGRSRAIEELRRQLESLRPPHRLTSREQTQVVASVVAIVGQTPWYAIGDNVAKLAALVRRLLNETQSSSNPTIAGFQVGIAGSLWLLGLVAVIGIPVGVGAGVFLEEYARPGRLRSFIQMNIANLAGVPSIVYGILGLALFVRALGVKGIALGPTLLSGVLTLSLLILPIIVLTTQEALRAVPQSLRQAAVALGGTRWQVVRDHVLPAALPGIMTGTILGLSRAIGETAPLLLVGAAGSILRLPRGPLDRYTALPVEIYKYARLPDNRFQTVAAGGILILLAMLLSMNAVAIVIRNRYRRYS